MCVRTIFDLRYEWFPGLLDQVLVGAFYKKLVNPIEYFVTQQDGPSSLFIKPENSNEATNYGAEAVVTKYFGMFGVSQLYLHTLPRYNVKVFIHLCRRRGQSDRDRQPDPPLQGQANNTGNISLLFKGQKMGLNVQLALAYTGDRSPRSPPMPTWTFGRNHSPSSISRWNNASVAISLSSPRSTT